MNAVGENSPPQPETVTGKDGKQYPAKKQRKDWTPTEAVAIARELEPMEREAAAVSGNLLPMGNIPTSERQARPLTQLEPEQQREAWHAPTFNLWKTFPQVVRSTRLPRPWGCRDRR